MRVSQSQIQEWTENPVTEALLDLSLEELNRIAGTPITDCYIPGEPQKTQDNLADLNTRRVVWATFCEFLKGDWSYLVEEDSE